MIQPDKPSLGAGCVLSMSDTRTLRCPAALSPALKVTLFAIVAFVLVAVCGLRMTYAQSELDRRENPPTNRALSNRSLPTESTVTLRITSDSGAVFEATQIEGETIRVRQKGGAVYGIVAYRRDNQVVARVFRTFKIEIKGEMLTEGTQEVDLFQIEESGSVLRTNDLGVKIEWVRSGDASVRKAKPGFPSISIQNVGAGGGGICCLECDGFEVCACKVIGTCGTCCVGTCCS